METPNATRSIKSQVIRGSLYGLLIGVLTPLVALGLTSYPPAALLQPGDITSSMIRDGEITGLDLNGAFALGKEFVGTSTINGVIPFLMNEGMATSSSFLFATATQRLGVATDTPGSHLSIGGNAEISGTTTTGSLYATSSMKLGNVDYQFPPTRGAANSVLTEDGGGGLSWALPAAGMDELCDTTLGISTSSIFCMDFGARDYLRFTLIVNQVGAASTNGVIRFNSDGGTNYAVRREDNGGADATAVSAVGIETTVYNADGILTCDITNLTQTNKYVFCTLAYGTDAATAPTKRILTGTWASTARVHTLGIVDDGGGSWIGAGSRLIVWGSAVD